MVRGVSTEGTGGGMSKPMTQTDPAYWMLEKGLKDPSKRSSTTVHSDCCYICQDPEFALMGLPLCYPCSECGGHVAADDSRCVNGHQSSHPSEEGIEDMRFTTDHFEFEGPASLLRKDDLFLVSGCMGRCLSFSGEVVEIEWISTPWPVKDGTKERLNVQTQGVLGYSKQRNSVMLVEGGGVTCPGAEVPLSVLYRRSGFRCSGVLPP